MKDRIPEFRNENEEAEFWDTHDSTDFQSDLDEDRETFAVEPFRSPWHRPGIGFLVVSLLGATSMLWGVAATVPDGRVSQFPYFSVGFFVELCVLILALSASAFRSFRSSLYLWVAILVAAVPVGAVLLSALKELLRWKLIF